MLPFIFQLYMDLKIDEESKIHPRAGLFATRASKAGDDDAAKHASSGGSVSIGGGGIRRIQSFDPEVGVQDIGLPEIEGLRGGKRPGTSARLDSRAISAAHTSLNIPLQSTARLYIKGMEV